MQPEFPIRIIFEDGECIVAHSPEDLLDSIDSIDSTRPDSRVWVRDDLDRTVRLRMHGGFVDEIEV